MKTATEIKEILSAHDYADVHVHTHLCDGSPDATVEKIAASAEAAGVGAVVLTPHFHKAVKDESESLYGNSDEKIFGLLREEIEAYKARGGRVSVLLSTEADILDANGNISLTASAETVAALDLVTPTVNYHPLLPLSFVHLTYGRDVNALHDSGAYARAAEAIGGVARVLTSFYDTYINAVLRCPYPCMVGHFFAAHSVHPDRNTWFGAREEHLPLMMDGARRVIDACRSKNAMLDLTGVHLSAGETVEERLKKNGFLVDFQRFVIAECRKNGVAFYAGSDAHSPGGVGGASEYYRYIMA